MSVGIGVKEQVIQIVQNLPEEATLDDVMKELYFKAKVDNGLKELDDGKGIPHMDVEKKLARRLTK